MVGGAGRELAISSKQWLEEPGVSYLPDQTSGWRTRAGAATLSNQWLEDPGWSYSYLIKPVDGGPGREQLPYQTSGWRTRAGAIAT